MKLGIISDTHIPERAPRLPSRIFDVFKDVDLILHAGDIETAVVLDELKSVAPVTAVAGNMDTLLRHLPYKREIKVANQWIGLIHGAGGPRNQIRERIRNEFLQARLIIYGHTHHPFWGQEGGVYYMNPGSPTDTVFAPFCSVGIVEICGDSMQGDIIVL
ncbi:MAG: metallophosphoesterase family protein [Deltaproteobacteria bacterium]|nr:metallophosphoesterase family protein [Deltaproteobacteria bacterium]